MEIVSQELSAGQSVVAIEDSKVGAARPPFQVFTGHFLIADSVVCVLSGAVRVRDVELFFSVSRRQQIRYNRDSIRIVVPLA